MRTIPKIITWLPLLLLWSACREKIPYAFALHAGASLGIDFENTLQPDSVMNMFKYMYFYNGAGIGAADFNNDGKTDIFLAGNQVADALYLNQGNLQFKESTKAAGIVDDKGWSTGVSVVDINHDGLMDIYVCRVGRYENLSSRNVLWVCTHIDSAGIPHYEEQAARYGIDFSGFSTQALFFDYDLDGDLDMYLMNHAVHHSGMFAPRQQFAGTQSLLSGDRLYQNEGGTYKDVTRQSGILSYEIGYGLGIVVCDANSDGWPDLYIGNDFHENDYLYINNQNGTFTEDARQWLGHTSQFTMGVDAADIDNDGLQDIVSLDMLPADPYILKRSLGEDAYDIFQMKVQYGYQHQYARNNLQLNTGAGRFAEAGLYSGIYATDWSWSALWMDFDHDGYKDLFVGNGIPKRLNDMDYVSFVTDRSYQQKIRTNAIGQKELALVEQFPEIKIPNYFFANRGKAQFERINAWIQNDQPTFSNGAVYADFDNDGDLDVMVNNIGDKPMLYENLCNPDSTLLGWQVSFTGMPANSMGIGCKVLLFSGGQLLLTEKQAVRGFQSSMEVPLHVTAGAHPIDSVWVVWPNNTYQSMPGLGKPGRVQIAYSTTLPAMPWQTIRQQKASNFLPTTDVTAAAAVQFVHHENEFREFNREALLPRMLSTEGPALAVADINGDGLQDFYAGNARNEKATVYVQQANGTFLQIAQPALQADSAYEDVDAVWHDVNGDGHPDLIVASGGNEYYGGHPLQLPRLYLNDGKGVLYKKENAFANTHGTWSCVRILDANADGKPDVFLGARAVPFQYGIAPASALCINDGTGLFTNRIAQISPALEQVGIVTDALWADIDMDGQKELMVATEWGGIYRFGSGSLPWQAQPITTLHGWWQCLALADINGDGLPDLIAGNMGLNNRLHPSPESPVQLYVHDFDGNGGVEQILTYRLQGRDIPFANKDELTRQLPLLKKKYLYAGDFAKASLEEMLGKQALKEATRLEVHTFAHTAFVQDEQGKFAPVDLPWQVQLTPLRTMLPAHGNGSQRTGIWVAGNFFENNIQMGRQDAGMPTLLNYNPTQKLWTFRSIALPQAQGQVRKMALIPLQGMQAMILAKNNDSLRIILPQP